MKYLIAAALAIFAFILMWFAASANAQGMQMQVILLCNSTEVVIKMLDEKYKEQVRGAGLNTRREPARLFVSEAKTWTLIVTRRDGISCIAAGGDNWTENPAKIKGDDL